MGGLSVQGICRAVGDGWSLVTRQSLHGVSLLLPGGSLGCGGEPFAPMNWAYVHGPEGAAEAVRRFAELLKERDLPATVTIASAVREEAEPVAEAAGLTREEKPSPLMTVELSPSAVNAGGFHIRPVEDEAGLGDAGLVLRDAYDVPLEYIANMIGPGVPDSSALTWFVGYDEGRPASACAVAVVGVVAGVYAVGTAHADRRKGAARATIATALRDCSLRGARVAGLLSDTAAIRLYEGLGFRTVDQPSEWRLEPGEAV